MVHGPNKDSWLDTIDALLDENIVVLDESGIPHADDIGAVGGEQIAEPASGNPSEAVLVAKLTARMENRVAEQLSKVVGGQPAATALYVHEADFKHKPEVSRVRTEAALAYLSALGFEAAELPDGWSGFEIYNTPERVEVRFWNLGSLTVSGDVRIVALMKDMQVIERVGRRPVGNERQILLINPLASFKDLTSAPYCIPDKTVKKAVSYLPPVDATLGDA